MFVHFEHRICILVWDFGSCKTQAFNNVVRKKEFINSNNNNNSLLLECDSQCSDESPIDMPPIPIGAIVPLRKASPERRIIQKEIVAGEERPKFVTVKHGLGTERKHFASLCI